jgi:hypothetical protein
MRRGAQCCKCSRCVVHAAQVQIIEVHSRRQRALTLLGPLLGRPRRTLLLPHDRRVAQVVADGRRLVCACFYGRLDGGLVALCGDNLNAV